jgi:uncharacterized SAM-binding protein YcdF (DUF218 family)
VFALLKDDHGDGSKLENFFFGNHPRLDERIANTQEVLKRNYPEAQTDWGVRNTDEFAMRTRTVVRENAALDIRAGRFGLAKAQLDRVLPLAPKDPTTHLYYGDLYRLQAQRARNPADKPALVAQALEAYDQAASLDPTYPDPFRQMGFLTPEQAAGSKEAFGSPRPRRMRRTPAGSRSPGELERDAARAPPARRRRPHGGAPDLAVAALQPALRFRPGPRREDALAASDALVIVAGGIPDREATAAELYRRGWAPLVVLSNNFTPHRVRELITLGVRRLDYQGESRLVLEKHGVPAEAIVALSVPVKTTEAELKLVAEAARARGWRRVILVTSPQHSRRVKLVWTREASGGIEAGGAGKGGRLPGEGWWWKRARRSHLLHEYPGLAAIYRRSEIPLSAADGASRGRGRGVRTLLNRQMARGAEGSSCGGAPEAARARVVSHERAVGRQEADGPYRRPARP